MEFFNLSEDMSTGCGHDDFTPDTCFGDNCDYVDDDDPGCDSCDCDNDNNDDDEDDD